MKKIYLVTIIIIAVLCIFVAAANPIEYWKSSMVEDTNVKSIPILTTINQGDITFTIDRLEVGDKYSTIYYEMSPAVSGESLKGAALYQNGEALGHITDGYSKGQGGAICYETTDDLENVSLIIAQIDDYTVTNYDFELEFEDNKCIFDAVVDGCKGTIEVNLRDTGIGIVTSDIQNLDSDGTSTRAKIPNDYLFYNEDTGESGNWTFNISNPPTHLRLIDKKYIVGRESIEIPIS